MKRIHEFETIEELKDFFDSNPALDLREDLLKEFYKLVKYKNIKEWNQPVRICESLSLAGWGERENFEAIAAK